MTDRRGLDPVPDLRFLSGVFHVPSTFLTVRKAAPIISILLLPGLRFLHIYYAGSWQWKCKSDAATIVTDWNSRAFLWRQYAVYLEV